jgi:hypothetical protein
MRTSMSADMQKGGFMSHSTPDVEYPAIQRSSRIVFEGKGRGVGRKKADRVEMISMNSNRVREKTGENGGGSDSIGFTVENPSRAAGRKRRGEGVVISDHCKCRRRVG